MIVKNDNISMAVPEALIPALVAAPETGMGYQLVDVVFKDGVVVKNAMVFNCEQLSVGVEHQNRIVDHIVLNGV